jgi:hypothetical protein
MRRRDHESGDVAVMEHSAQPTPIAFGQSGSAIIVPRRAHPRQNGQNPSDNSVLKAQRNALQLSRGFRQLGLKRCDLLRRGLPVVLLQQVVDPLD